MSADDLVAEFRAYLARFEQMAGHREFGEFVKYQGRLVKKLTYDEFCPKWDEYLHMKGIYEETLMRGDTINDAVVRILKERAAELVLEPPL